MIELSFINDEEIYHKSVYAISSVGLVACPTWRPTQSYEGLIVPYMNGWLIVPHKEERNGPPSDRRKHEG